MKNTLAILLSGLAWLQSAEAACCRTNECLKAIVNPKLDGGGLGDCSRLLAVTITASAAAVTSTSTMTLSPVISTQQTTVVETEVETQTETSKVSTETQVLSTVTDTTTVTTSTRTFTGNNIRLGSTTTVTGTQTVMITLAPSTVTVSWTTVATLPVERRAISTPSAAESQVPTYAALVCPSWDKYVSACHCAGITAAPTVTVTEAPVVTTVVVTEEPSAVVETSTVLSTLVTTTTETLAVTATTQATQTNTESITAVVTTVSWTTRAGDTVTIPAITTATVTPSPLSLACQNVPRSYIRGTPSTGAEKTLYADVQNGMAGVYGGGTWVEPGQVANQPVDRLLFDIDASGNVHFMTSGYHTVWYVDASPVSTGNPLAVGNSASVQVRIILKSQFDYAVDRGQQYVALKGCADQATGKLLLNIGGRTNALFCNGNFYMSSGTGSDVAGPGCTQATLKMVTP